MFLKKCSAEASILLTKFQFFSAKGLYKLEDITAPTPNSNNEIIEINCVIEFTSPLISDPKADKITFGRIKPQIITTNW